MAKRHIQPELITLAAAARRLGITVPTAARLAARGEIPPISRLGRRRYLPRRAFEARLADLTGVPAEAAA
jgi:excisionase family DNA binding protein